jgi:hypothetical protein
MILDKICTTCPKPCRRFGQHDRPANHTSRIKYHASYVPEILDCTFSIPAHRTPINTYLECNYVTATRCSAPNVRMRMTPASSIAEIVVRSWHCCARIVQTRILPITGFVEIVGLHLTTLPRLLTCQGSTKESIPLTRTRQTLIQKWGT